MFKLLLPDQWRISGGDIIVMMNSIVLHGILIVTIEISIKFFNDCIKSIAFSLNLFC
jgi:hypothetical protein